MYEFSSLVQLSTCLSSQMPDRLDYSGIVVNFEVRHLGPPTLVFFAKLFQLLFFVFSFLVPDEF